MSLIMLADDDDLLVQYVQSVLEENGHDVLSCDGGGAAIEMSRKVHPDLIILDAMMPRIDGYQVLWHLKQNAETRDIPVMMLTARSRPQDEEMGLSLGASEYVIKPFSLEEVLEKTDRLLNSRIDAAGFRRPSLNG